MFNNTAYTGYSDPPSGNPFQAYYSDECVAATPQSNGGPVKPNPPTGPLEGMINVEYTYSGSTTDPNQDDIYYIFDWGDGTDSGWLGPYPSGSIVESSHAWEFGGTYAVKLKAKDDSVDGPWSEPINVQISGPTIQVENLKGGLFRVSADITNPGDQPISNVNWKITLHSGAFIGKTTSGSNITISANSSVTIQSGFIVGLGSTNIKVEAWVPNGPSSMSQRMATILLFYIKVLG